eukprot:GAFH01004294.1.p5 GENE.GAFH01004294.1~~GAFH01004294.1.p5  ORF type:complete len:61 (-),score=7.05 GAFH01004294.1:170-352(-)
MSAVSSYGPFCTSGWRQTGRMDLLLEDKEGEDDDGEYDEGEDEDEGEGEEAGANNDAGKP